MPIYEYQCEKCKTHSEVFQKVNDKPLVKCTKCGGRLEKLISASAIQFKGSGWYVTDYASKSEKASRSDGEGSKDDKAADKQADKKAKESSPETKSSSKASSKVPSKD